MAGRNYWNHMAGHEMGQKFFRLWGSERDLMGQKAPLRKRIEKWLINMEELNAFRMTKENMFEYVEKINNEKPSLIEAYVNPMYELATFAEKENLEIIPPKAIITSAGTLYPDMKEKIERVFGCPVWNRYGTREVGDMACGKDRLKIATWTHYVETVDKKGEITEDVGRVLVTNLRNYSMPLIRYDIGDIAKLDKEWGYFEKVEGREVAVLKTKDGRIVSGLLFVHYFGVVMNNGFIKRFQLIQKDYDKIEIKVIVNDRKKFEGKKVEIADLIEKAMGYRCKINWIETENIEPLKSGKYLYVKSEI
jgi:phenylacetate-CoA ligase